MRQHGKRDVTVPAGPRAHLVPIQPDLALGRLEAGLDRPTHSRHPHQRLQAGRSRRQGQVEGQLARLLERAPDQKAGLPALGHERAVGQVDPIVEPGPLRALAGAQAPPSLGRHVLEPVLDRLEAQPLRAGHRQHVAAPVPLDQAPEAMVRAVDAVAGHPSALGRSVFAEAAADGSRGRTARPPPAPASAWPRRAWAWSRTRPRPAHRPSRTARRRRPSARAGRARGRSAPVPSHWRRRGTPRSGSSRSGPRCRNTAAARRPNACPSSRNR